ncbi:deoxyribodipyrimidine photo-lyase [uncultured Chitinophaga sp.]|jgi:Deoxyribodipyrimidine photolyase|uniref:cryptochrome/photolyase family protein n=1 Tax=uncultured Chitinophaga sp. TaxID=339340 RepID=UPI002637A2E7|nr:deoxyribodipyrimidine photo-lyase [uncultured Chitinophaga sp.]
MDVNVFWFRRDLRLEDNAGLYHALKKDKPVLPVFIFDTDILDQLDNKADLRVEFIHSALEKLQQQLTENGTTLEVYHGKPLQVFKQLLSTYNIGTVFTNHDYEPYAIARDNAVRKLLQDNGVAFDTFKDQVIFEKNEVMKDDGRPYTVFTPYSKRWLATLDDHHTVGYPVKRHLSNFFHQPAKQLPSLASIGFRPGSQPFPDAIPDDNTLRQYEKQRDFPALEGTTRIGVHLRFGTISIRDLVRRAAALSPVYLKELVWREFYQMILWHFPHVGQGKAFRPEYDHINWRDNEADFERWCNGTTGYPIVDAGMRELSATGFMHNRVRMITASFLSKHLLIDWRWGEAWFAEKLLDYELASNNGNWQWAAGTGCDAAPYFRIFNPTLQAKKFDPKLEYIRKWIPELNSLDYPQPVVAHEFARQRCLEAYSKALKNVYP